MLTKGALLTAFCSLLVGLLRADSIPTITLTDFGYSVPGETSPPVYLPDTAVLYYGTGFSLDMFDEFSIVPRNPPPPDPFVIVGGGQLNGPFPIPGRDTIIPPPFQNVLGGNAIGDLGGDLVGMPGQLIRVAIFGSGELNFAPLVTPPGLTSLVSVSEPAIATGQFTACLLLSSDSCSNPVANILLNIEGNMTFYISPIEASNPLTYQVAVNFRGNTVVPEPASRGLALAGFLLVTAVFWHARKKLPSGPTDTSPLL